jgi:hypothetical protein
MAKEWLEFKVGKVSTQTNWTNKDCQPFSTITHTTHIEMFFNMLDDGAILPRLVYDESKLNTKRILVVWLSPNTWGVGYRYGTIQLELDWTLLIKDMRIYWVERITKYKINALRILLTDQNRDTEFEEYNPEDRTGPWWYDKESDVHYFNGKYCLEIMVERSIPLKQIKGFQFVNHHRAWCSRYPKQPTKCSELGINSHKSSISVLAQILKRGIICNENYLLDTRVDLLQSGNPFKDAAEFLFYRLKDAEKGSGHLTKDDEAAFPVFQSIMDSISRGDKESYVPLIKLFKSFDEIKLVFKTQVQTCFSMSNEEINRLIKRLEQEYE